MNWAEVIALTGKRQQQRHRIEGEEGIDTHILSVNK